MPDRPAAASSPLALTAVVIAAALALLLPGLGDYGIWTDAEMPAFDRVRAALGEALRDLEHHPWLPEFLRTQGYAATQSELGFRLPHALAAASLAGIAAGLARSRGASTGLSLMAGCFALAFPVLAVSGRTVLGNPIGELTTTFTIVAGLLALRTDRSLLSILGWTIAAAASMVLAVLSVGLAIGAALPLGVLATAAMVDGRNTKAAIGLGVASLITLSSAAMLSIEQGNGYIPILGAAKDLILIDKPQDRRFAAGLHDFGYALYPWAPLVVAGALLGHRDRLPTLWLGLAVVVAGGFSLVYGSTPLPITVPAALCVVSGVEWTLDPRTDRTGRRAALAVVILATLVMRKDAEHSPGHLAVPVHELEGEHTFPNEEVGASEQLKQIGGFALLAVLGAGLLAPAGRRKNRLDRLIERIPAGPLALAPVGLLSAAALFGAYSYAHTIVPRVCGLLSPRALLEHHDALVQAGQMPPQLGLHRVRDPGLALYGPGDVSSIGSRRELANYLSSDEPRAAIIRDRDLPALHQSHRAKGWPLVVLDDDHSHLRLVANVLPPGETDLNPISAVVFDEAPTLENPTQLQFEDYIEIVGWQVTDPVVRGREVTLQLAIRVLKPLPGGTKLYARLQKDRSSRLNTEPHDLTDGVYPPNMWRDGDYILHTYRFKAPLLEIQPGEHELIIGLRRGEQQNFGISVPEGKKGEFGVRVRDKKRNFARIGQVQVW